MKSHLKFLIVPLLLIGLMPLPAQEQAPAVDVPTQEAEEDEFNDTEFGVATTLAHTVSSTTGIGMSPLLGMGVLGAWKYLRSDPEMRESLPWYTGPWVWGMCFGIFVLLKSKDTIGVLIPEIAKKPITVLDAFQEKASALIVALAVIPPAVLQELEEMAPQTTVEGVAMVPFVLPVFAVAIAIIVFGVVWFAFNALSSIKVLSPSSLVNSMISVVKGAFISVFAFASALNPWVGLALSLVIIVFCALIFGWSFRWNVFGSLFLKDFFTQASQKPLEDGEKLKGFSTGSFPDVKPRTYGEVERVGDELVFSWRPWLLGLKKSSRIKISDFETSVRKGIFQPSVTMNIGEESRHRSVVDLRLRYRNHDEAIRESLALDSVSPNLVINGMHASWLWIKDQLKRGGTAITDALDPGLAPQS